MFIFRLRWFLAAGLLLILGFVGMAQTTQNATAQATAAVVQRLVLDTTLIDFGTLIEADYDAGYKELTPAQVLTIKSNVGWQVTVKASSATWSYTGTEPDPSKPCADLEWKSSSSDSHVTATQATYTGMTTTDAQVAAGSRGGNITVNAHFKMLLNYENDPPGSYSIDIVYTLSAQ